MGLVLSSAKPPKTKIPKPPRLSPRNPLVLGTAFSLCATASRGGSICSAFAASTVLASGLRRRAFVREGSIIRRDMTAGGKTYRHAPPLATVSPFSRCIKNVVIVGGTHGNEYTVSFCLLDICFLLHNKQMTFSCESFCRASGASNP